MKFEIFCSRQIMIFFTFKFLADFEKTALKTQKCKEDLCIILIFLALLFFFLKVDGSTRASLRQMTLWLKIQTPNLRSC